MVLMFVEFRKNSNPDPELLKLLPEKNDNELWFYLCWNMWDLLMTF